MTEDKPKGKTAEERKKEEDQRALAMMKVLSPAGGPIRYNHAKTCVCPKCRASEGQGQ